MQSQLLKDFLAKRIILYLPEKNLDQFLFLLLVLLQYYSKKIALENNIWTSELIISVFL